MTGRGRESATPNEGTENGPYTYGWPQSRIFDNGRKPDRATPRAGRRASACKLLLSRKKSCRFTTLNAKCKSQNEKLWKRLPAAGRLKADHKIFTFYFLFLFLVPRGG